MKLLFIGDIFGRPGRRILRELLPEIRREYGVDFVIANGENSASGAGITEATYREILESGVDFVTSGDHIWDKEDIYPILESKGEKLIRPANYPATTPGRGYDDVVIKGERLRIINLQGNVFMRADLEQPFSTIDRILAEPNCPAATFIDFHAEATSEKIAFSHYVDGRVTAVVGTHTHVQTNDARLLERGTAALTDAGLTGPRDGVIGEDKEVIIKHYLSQMPWKHDVAAGAIQLSGCVITLDASGRAESIELVQRQIEA